MTRVVASQPFIQRSWVQIPVRHGIFHMLQITFISSSEAVTLEVEKKRDKFMKKKFPLVINTWNYTIPTTEAWMSVLYNLSALDVVTNGISVCEFYPSLCNFEVGFGGSPDEDHETTLDALLMDGVTMKVGAVGDLHRIKNAIGVAKYVLLHTKHSLLVGESATNFAKNMGFKEELLTLRRSDIEYSDWEKNDCQPNYWVDVEPDENLCSLYIRTPKRRMEHVHDFQTTFRYSEDSHDSKENNFRKNEHNENQGSEGISMLFINEYGYAAAGSSSNGLKHKIPGFLAVEEMRRGRTPRDAAYVAVERISSHYPNFFGAVVAADNKGNFGAACSGMERFQFSVMNNEIGQVTVFSVTCT
ncbi:N(4)-(Beta-N-acetylglucosaminyl)-L-asparaginase-like isoform X2 [Lycorma delicatula]|uniref:N(4)-(Beta-N-acetylglucosaminyl)-L-asparaginase- like isoform X2 n=1 Tax=Lycorma delicatula TaxID=130591 RepID=UPI003F5194FD